MQLSGMFIGTRLSGRVVSPYSPYFAGAAAVFQRSNQNRRKLGSNASSSCMTWHVQSTHLSPVVFSAFGFLHYLSLGMRLCSLPSGFVWCSRQRSLKD